MERTYSRRSRLFAPLQESDNVAHRDIQVFNGGDHHGGVCLALAFSREDPSKDQGLERSLKKQNVSPISFPKRGRTHVEQVAHV